MVEYISHPYQQIEDFLYMKGTVINARTVYSLINDPVNVGVCMIDNLFFNVAVAITDVKKLTEYAKDTRTKVFYSVPRAELRDIGCKV